MFHKKYSDEKQLVNDKLIENEKLFAFKFEKIKNKFNEDTQDLIKSNERLNETVNRLDEENRNLRIQIRKNQ